MRPFTPRCAAPARLKEYSRLPRWSALLAVMAAAALVCAVTIGHPRNPASLELQISQTTLPADGFTSAELKIRSSDGRDLHGLIVNSQVPHRVAIESLVVTHSSAIVALRAGVLPGEAKVRIAAAGYPQRQVALAMTFDRGDSIGDGTPDFLRLHDPADRAAFRRWFTLLAEAQYYRNGTLPTEIDDCAALLRFSYREALRPHDAAWAQAMALPAPASSSDIQQYQFPFTPLGAAIFRVHTGSFEPTDLREGAFAEFADAQTLWRRNTFFVSRELNRARPGDLLFFRQDGHDMPFHVMIFLGHSRIEPDSEQFVVYHTGPIGKSPGEIRRPSLAELMNHPEARWHPAASNPNFLGVYRWNILRGAE